MKDMSFQQKVMSKHLLLSFMVINNLHSLLMLGPPIPQPQNKKQKTPKKTKRKGKKKKGWVCLL